MNTKEIGEFAMLKEKVNNIGIKQDVQAKQQREDFQRIFNKLDSLDDKFASKWVEKLVLGILIALVGSAIGFLIYCF